MLVIFGPFVADIVLEATPLTVMTSYESVLVAVGACATKVPLTDRGMDLGMIVKDALE